MATCHFGEQAMFDKIKVYGYAPDYFLRGQKHADPQPWIIILIYVTFERPGISLMSLETEDCSLFLRAQYKLYFSSLFKILLIFQ